MVQAIPVDTHVVGDPGHTPDHDNIADMLGLIASVIAQQGGSPNLSAIPPASAAVTVLQNLLTSQQLDNSRTFHPEAYGALGNGRMISDGSITTGTATFTSTAQASFTTGDVGKYILVAGAGDATGTRTLVTTISAWLSPTQVTLATNALATVSSGGYAVYGNDDTAAINSAVSAAFAYASTVTGGAFGPLEAVVQFLPRIYMVAGNPIQGGTTKGNAQIPLPFVAMSSPKITILFNGIPDTPLIHFGLNSTPIIAGAALVCCNTTGTLNGTYGPASVIGGYTHEQGAGDSVFSNFRPIIQGLTIVVPYNSTFSGVDCYGCVGMGIRSLCCTAFATPTQMNNPQTNIAAGNQWTFGLRTPTTSNDGNPFVDNYVANGFWIGAAISEHVSASRGFTLYNGIGIQFFSTTTGSPMLHCTRLHYWCCEANNQHIAVNGTDVVQIDIGTLDVDNGVGSSQKAINDPSSQIHGSIMIRGNSGSYNFSTGMARLRVIDGDHAYGSATPPSVPATTVALLNPFWRDAAVTITPGASTCAVSVDGTATGLVLASGGVSGTVTVPTGKTVTLTYTSAPTWAWVLL